DLELVGFGEIGRILHRGIERAPQRLDARRRHVRRQKERTAVFQARASISRSAARSPSVLATSRNSGTSSSSGLFCRAHCTRMRIFFSVIQSVLMALSVDQLAMVPSTSPLSIARWIFGVLS